MTADNKCEYRVDQDNTGPAVVVGSGAYSSKVCTLMLIDPDGMIAPFCLAPTCSTTTCPIPKYIRGEIGAKRVQDELVAANKGNTSV